MTRFINCEVCQTEGRILTNDGGPDDVDHGVCPACNGERVVEVETQPCGPFSECPDCGQTIPLLFPCLAQECPAEGRGGQ
jgi:hypothetical protein